MLVNGTYSQETSITSGVPQGSILGPLLFCIFINDLPLCLTRASVQCDLFADDGTLNTANDNIDNIRRDLQQSLYDVSGWCCRNRTALNPTKTKCMKQLYSLHKRAVKFLMPIPNLDYKQKCCALKLLPLDKQLLLNKCVLKQKVVHGKAPQYLKDLMIPSGRLHVHGNKQLLPRARIDIFETSFSFSGSLAWNSLAHHLRYPMELKTFKRKAFQALAN